MVRIEAYVLHQVNYKDTSKILYLYSDQGHHTVIAHGVKKLNSINRFLSQVGNKIRLDINPDKDMSSLQDGELIEDYEPIKHDIMRYTYMSHILQLVRNTISADLDHPKMMKFLDKLFYMMEDGVDEELLTFVFELKLLFFLGHGLHLHGCTMCDKDQDLVFHINSGGLVCQSHLHPSDTHYDSDTYHSLMVLYYIDITTTPLPEFTPNDRVRIRHIIDLLYDEFVGYRTKSREILRQLKKY